VLALTDKLTDYESKLESMDTTDRTCDVNKSMSPDQPSNNIPPTNTTNSPNHVSNMDQLEDQTSSVQVKRVPESLTIAPVDSIDRDPSNASSRDPSGCLSPGSYCSFKEFLHHTPDLNLPWQSMRTVSQCGCGVPFSYSRRKVGERTLYTNRYIVTTVKISHF